MLTGEGRQNGPRLVPSPVAFFWQRGGLGRGRPTPVPASRPPGACRAGARPNRQGVEGDPFPGTVTLQPGGAEPAGNGQHQRVIARTQAWNAIGNHVDGIEKIEERRRQQGYSVIRDLWTAVRDVVAQEL